jgi:hypothetical protein
MATTTHTQPDDTVQGSNPENRSENMLPTGADDSADDGRFDVAEEVSLDQQSDSSRKVGQLPDDDAAKALADSIDEKTQTGM